MRHFLTALLITLLFVCAAPCAALSIETSGGTAGQPVTVTMDGPAFVTFQMDSGVPVYAYGTTVNFIPATTGTLSITAESGGEVADATVTVVTGGGGGGGGDTPSIVWKTVTLPTGTFNVTADNSEEIYAVKWQTALGVLEAAGISFKVSDKWDSGLFVLEVDGKPTEGTAGWMYQVNGVSPALTADKKSVSANDRVVWYYSESMSQTPEQSSRAFFFKVQTSTAPAPGGSSTETGETETEPDAGAEAASYPLSLPPGSDLRLSEGRMYLTVNVPMATSAGDQISFEGNTMLITREDVILKIRFADFTDKKGIIAGEITDVNVETMPVTVICAGGATPEIGLLISLMTVPMDADVDVIATPLSGLSDVPAAVLNAANRALSADGMAVGTAGWQMDVEKRGLENGVDVGDVTVRITTDPACIAQAGGISALRLIHIMDDGTAEVLALRSVGTTADGKTILEAGPAAGLSSFLFVSVTDAPASSGTAAATPAPTGTPAPTESGTPLSALCAAAAGIIGITAIYRNQKR
ncbi:DUF4430 domain-containing protein [Methanogenium sp. MK-MG]|uniref:DUF4430 domain-containing protein n=1 Tax=Methanogenium sp. MK-MG TaxID=2599926 RepID=UPI0013EA9989|nr:DUF4430 domain-containing protein [Methanogenium sp. MK-MG]KAF1078781.1 hypothetical protein MKMG_00331 [Methanogenium sp. MK-MG]